MAEILGKQKVAQQAWNRYYARIEQLKTALNNQYQDKTISVISILGDWGTSISTKNSFSGSILQDIGLQRPKDQMITAPYGRISISEEKLDTADGDILFVQTFGIKGQNNLEKLKNKSLWRKIKAVQKNRVYFVDHLTWTGGNLLAADAVINDLYKYLIDTP